MTVASKPQTEKDKPRARPGQKWRARRVAYETPRQLDIRVERMRDAPASAVLKLVFKRDGLLLGKAARPTERAFLAVLDARVLPKDRDGIHHPSFAFDDAAVVERAVRTGRAKRLAERVETRTGCSTVDAVGLAPAADVDAVVHDRRLLRRSCADRVERAGVDAEHVGEERASVEGDEEGQGEELR